MTPFKYILYSVLIAAFAAASPLSETTAVQSSPDPSAPVITFLKAGSEPVPAPQGAVAPAGWMAVTVAGPFDGYVENKNLTKNLQVKAGSPVCLAPKADAGVLEFAAKDDNLSITGIRGKWTQVRLDKNLVGYIRLGGATEGVPLAALAAAGGELQAPPPVSQGATGKAADMSASWGSEVAPSFFEGRFLSAKRRFFWEPMRPYDWQLAGSSGSRLAYLDTSRLLLTDQLENYVGRDVLVRGSAKGVLGTRDIVIVVDSLQLK